MRQRSLLLSAFIAAALSSGVYAQGAGSSGGAGAGSGSSGAGSSAGEGPVPGGRSGAQDSTVAPTTGSSSSSSSSVPAAGSAYPGEKGTSGARPSSSMSTSGTASGSGTSAATGGTAAAPLSRAEVQAEGTAAIHGGELPRGDALVTRSRPKGGPINADGMHPGGGSY
ncbi:MAG TPA: hypothetical protein VFZ93_14555 [Albitalea sp.]